MASARNVIEEFMLLLEDWENSVTVNMNFMSDLERFYPENLQTHLFRAPSPGGRAD